MLKVEKFGVTRIKVTDTETEEVIYDATPDVDCVLEALAFHFDEDLEFEEHEPDKIGDPLEEANDSNDDPDIADQAEFHSDFVDEYPEDGTELDSTPFVQIQINDGNDYLDDDYDDEN